MPPKGWKKPKKDAPEAEDTDTAERICDLLSRIPLDYVITMVTISGLPRDEARELCDLVKGLNG